MSEFDKDAERERLREKYERDQKKREATEKMSELLLQGATMTNAHCSECNDPIFRYDGQEFCATCEKPIERATGDEQSDGEGDSAAIEVTSPSDDARVAFGGEAAEEDADGEERSQVAEETHEVAEEPHGVGTESQEGTGPARDGLSGTGPASEGPSGTASEPDTERQQRADAVERRASLSQDDRRRLSQTSATERPESGVADLNAARESLVRTLVRFSERAEASEDPRQARDNLAAAREAAETLAALRR